MKIKRFWIVAAVLLASVLLVTNCVDPVGPLAGKAPAKVPGHLTLTINDSGMRTATTLTPGSVPTAGSYIVSVVGVGTGAGSSMVLETILPGAINNPIPLQEGDYTVTVTAYENANPTGTQPFAMGAENISIDENGETADIDLKEISGSGTGIFTWNFGTIIDDLNLDGDPGDDSAIMTIVQIGGSAETQTPQDLIVDPIDSINTIPAGFYNVTVTVEKEDHYRFSTNRVVHIYSGMETTWTYTTAITLIEVVTHTITFNASGGTVTSTNPLANVVHGDTISAPTATPPTDEAPDGWWTKDGTSDDWGNFWIFATTKVLRSQTLYARWIEVQTGDLNISLTDLTTIAVNDLVAAGAASINISDFQFPENDSEIITITASGSGGPYTNIKWFINTIEVAGETEAVLEIDFSSDDATNIYGITSPGTYEVTVIATADSKPWSARVLIIVIDDNP